MTELDRFTLEGQTYYQQGRKCGREGCKCQQGDLHGPYWYTRNTDSGKVAYIGKDLPPAIAGARYAHDLLLPDMVRERRRLASLFDAVSRLLRNDPLSDADRRAIEALGLGAALVSTGGPAPTQDGGALVSFTWSARTQDDGAAEHTSNILPQVENSACVDEARDRENTTQDDGALVRQGSWPGTQGAGLCAAILGGTQGEGGAE